MYADYEYYTTVYGGRVFGSADAFIPYGRRSERRIDIATGNKLWQAFPAEERSVEAVKDCVCELAEFLFRVDSYTRQAEESTGVSSQPDGTVKGRLVTSVSAGSESITYSAGGQIQTAVSAAAKNRGTLDTAVSGIIRSSLSGITGADGINLLYAGM